MTKRSEITGSHAWRLPFLGGLVLGGAISALSSGGWAPLASTLIKMPS